MSNRVTGFTVILANDLKDEDAKGIADAIMRLSGVSSVAPILPNVSALERWRARHELIQRLLNMLTEEHRKEACGDA